MEATQIGEDVKKLAGSLMNPTPMRPLLSSDDYDRMKSRWARQKQDDAQREAWNKSRVPARYQAAVVSENGEWDKRLIYLSERLFRGTIFALVGTRGTGKTHMAVECMRQVCDMGRGILYCTAMEVFIAIKDSYRKDSETTEDGVIRRYTAPELLVIDEAQERGETKWEDRMLTAIIDGRYSRMKDTILISNLTRKAFEESMGSSVVSRMSETGGIIECNWPSFRGVEK